MLSPFATIHIQLLICSFLLLPIILQQLLIAKEAEGTIKMLQKKQVISHTQC